MRVAVTSLFATAAAHDGTNVYAKVLFVVAKEKATFSDAAGGRGCKQKSMEKKFIFFHLSSAIFSPSAPLKMQGVG